MISVKSQIRNNLKLDNLERSKFIFHACLSCFYLQKASILIFQRKAFYSHSGITLSGQGGCPWIYAIDLKHLL